MKYMTLMAIIVIVSGCTKSAQPSFFNGNYYMMGDKSCVQAYNLSSTRIMCGDKNRKETGYRDALTREQLQMYWAQMQYQQMQMQQLGQQMQETSESIRNSSNQILQQSMQYQPPQVQPISPPGGYGGSIYNQVGNTILGPNGSSCQRVGNTIICSDGSRCQIVGSSMICN